MGSSSRSYTTQEDNRIVVESGGLGLAKDSSYYYQNSFSDKAAETVITGLKLANNLSVKSLSTVEDVVTSSQAALNERFTESLKMSEGAVNKSLSTASQALAEVGQKLQATQQGTASIIPGVVGVMTVGAVVVATLFLIFGKR